MVLAACTATGASDADRAKQRVQEARKASAAQARVQGNRDPGCQYIVTSQARRFTAPPKDLLLLSGAEAVSEPCWDRITFVFDPTGQDLPPGYEVEYRKPPFVEGPTGAPVETLGDAFLFVTFTPASATDARDPGRPIQVYRGNLRLRLQDMHHAVIVRKLVDGDGTVMWLIGLDAKRPFTVDASNQPPRVSILVMS
jgi:hypothetical protein